MASTDSRLTDARTPKAHNTSHQNGGTDEIATTTAAEGAIPKAGPGATLGSAWLPAATTAVAGAVVLAVPSTDTAAGHAVQACDARLSDARTPTPHASSHQTGSDKVATTTPGANAIPMTGTETSLGEGWIPTTLSGSRTFSGVVTFGSAPKVDTIGEKTTNNGVQIKGRAGDTAVASGYVGETVSSSDASNWTEFITPPSGMSRRRLTQRDNATPSIALDAGIWLVTLQVAVWAGSGTSTNIINLGIGWSVNNNDDWTDLAELGNEGNNMTWIGSVGLCSASGVAAGSLTLPVRLSSSKTLHPMTIMKYPDPASGVYSTRLRFYAVRIA